MNKKLLLGAHMSTSGGVHSAFGRGTSIGCTTMQVFVKNNNQWHARPLSDEDIQNYKTEEAKASIAPVIAHAAYLINLCAASAPILQKSRLAFIDELQRCEILGIKALVFHPGAHVGAGEAEGIRKIAESLNVAHEQTSGFHVLSALESTAGQEARSVTGSIICGQSSIWSKRRTAWPSVWIRAISSPPGTTSERKKGGSKQSASLMTSWE